MRASQLTDQDLNQEIIDKLLYEGMDYRGAYAPCALVLGSSKAHVYRVPVAVSLYKQGKVQKLLMSGGKTWNFPEGIMSEARRMKGKAVEEGVPEEDILMDEQSFSTQDNMLYTCSALEGLFNLTELDALILVTSGFHMRRSLLTAQSLMPNWIQIIPCPAEDTHTRRDNWWQSEEGRQRATNEAKKLLHYIHQGSLSDFTI